MDINDYSNRLNQARTRFSDAQQELKENYNNDIERLEELHAKREENQRENYLKQKLNSEEESAARINRYDKDLKQELATRTERYNKGLEGERKQFNEDRKRLMDDYNQKLDSISKSFETSSTEKDKLHALYKDNMTERYEEGLSMREKDFNEKLATMQSTATEKINDYRDLTTREKKKLISDFGNERKQLVQDASIARNKANSRHQVEMERLREAAKQNETTLKNNFDSANTSLRQTKNAQIEGQRETFENLSKDIMDRNQAELIKLNRQNKAEKRDLERDFASNRLSLERRTNALINEGRGNKIEDTEKNLRSQHAIQVRNLKDTIEANNYIQNKQNERLAQGHSEELKKLESRHEQAIDEKDAEIRKVRETDIAAVKKELGDYQERMTKRNRDIAMESEANQVKARRNLTDTLDRQRTEFGREINKINLSNQQALSNVRDEMAKEQSKFIEKTRREVHHDREDLKDELRTNFAKKEESLNKQIEMERSEKMKMEEAYQKKIDVLTTKSAKELEKLKIIENERRIEEKRAANQQMLEQQREFEKTLSSLRREFDRRLSRAKSNSDIRAAKLTQKYEAQVKREREEHSATMDRQNRMMTENYNRLLHKTNMERDNLINQYELKIEKLREANRLAKEIEATRPYNQNEA
ncbi:MAG: hypothetical protein VXV96_10025 [Bdellovibrionota bacterium]|nr:hypothetical protein [Bdellovibrionota bacterium]